MKAQKGHKDADACLTVPLVLGVADGVSQIEDFGIDASMLPNELLQVVEQLGMHQLIPGAKLSAADTYRGPVSMLRRAFEATESLGSLTVVLAVMDNSTRIWVEKVLFHDFSSFRMFYRMLLFHCLFSTFKTTV